MSQLQSYSSQPDQPDTLRLWLSDQQWMTLLSRIEQGRPISESPASSRRTDERYAMQAQCMLRIKQPSGRCATYMVRTRDLSNGGVGFVHHESIEPGSICTFALQGSSGSGRILTGQVAWCQPVESESLPLFTVGLQFDEAINAEDFAA